jgi:hypothetical protein
LVGAGGVAHADTVTFNAGFSDYVFSGATSDAGCGSGTRNNYDIVSGGINILGHSSAATGTFSQCGGTSSPITGGQFTLTATDGSGSIFGTLSPIDYFFSVNSTGSAFREGFASFTITGGTLTFADASGSGGFHNFENLNGSRAGMGNAGLSGTISGPNLRAPIPEPATLLLLGTGLGGVVASLRNRRRRRI